MNINWKEVWKFMSGVFFAGAGANWFMATQHVYFSFLGIEFTPFMLAVRGSIHFVLFLVTFYWGFVMKTRPAK
jgi:hypothetical protein